ncbi:Endonuclease/exonuclease/phosphatase [Zopfochytrium polystomum]|nr:Endonuclease/exonuclease/phosphatase [Zopfochytrium polystomum]
MVAVAVGNIIFAKITKIDGSSRTYRPSSTRPNANSFSALRTRYTIPGDHGHIPTGPRTPRQETHKGRLPKSSPTNSRRWTSIPILEDNPNKVPFTLLSYNILAPSLVDRNPQLYDRCHPSDVSWKTRAEKLVNQIVRDLNPDIAALQEVEHFEFFREQLDNFLGEFMQRRGEDFSDGCALFWKKDVFDCIHVEKIHYGIGGRANIAIAAVLELKHSVGADMPQRQRILLEKVKYLSTQFSNTPETEIPVIICGDLNLLPGSDLHKYLLSGVFERILRVDEGMMSGQYQEESLAVGRSPRKEPSAEIRSRRRSIYKSEPKLPVTYAGITTHILAVGEEAHALCVMKLSFDQLGTKKSQRLLQHNSGANRKSRNGALQHPFIFKSAVPCACPETGEEYVTTCHSSARHMVDYIFHSASEDNCLEAVEFLSLPTGRDSYKKLPTSSHPSDHYPLLVKFRWD